jgi:peptide chain release factor 2
MGQPGFWDRSEVAQQTVGKLKSLKSLVSPLQEVIAAQGDLSALMEMAEEDDSAVNEVRAEIERL